MFCRGKRSVITRNAVTIAIISMYLLLTNISCQKKPMSIDEQAFKYLAGKWYKEVERVAKIPPEKTQIGEFGVQWTLHKRSKYIKSRESEFRSIDEEITNFIREYSSSPWVDDAAVCLCIQYLFISTPEISFREEAIQAYRMMVDNYPRGMLQPWTMDMLIKIEPIKTLILNPIAPPTDNYFGNLSIYQKLREVFIRGIVTEHLKVKDFESAEREYEKMKEDTTINKHSLKVLEEIIDAWKTHVKEGGESE